LSAAAVVAAAAGESGFRRFDWEREKFEGDGWGSE
jgi:hypothetical protein